MGKNEILLPILEFLNISTIFFFGFSEGAQTNLGICLGQKSLS